ncbi:putative polyketide synthase, partial [Ilyonectria destructans]
NSTIAIVGYAYRAPGVGRKGLWDFLTETKSAWSRVPGDRFDQDAFFHPNSEKAGFISAKGGHFLPDDIYAFDAPFFNLKADEARAMDPQHRMMLECALEAAESAGITLADLAGTKTGVFAANDVSDYSAHTFEDLPTTSKYTAIGTAPCMFANRLSYFFDLTGPSIAVDGACASSSYALHMACQSIRLGECSTAIVGGAKAIVSPNYWSALDTLGAMSGEGKCFSYDPRASGFGRGEGGATLIIKRLSEAIACGDPIRAVIRNSAANHSGRSQGITMPSQAAQEELLQRLHREVNMDPNETRVVEGHGTGTQAGDPIEAAAFATVLASKRTSHDPLYLGSLKSNFGHLESASGVLAVVKAIMMIEQGVILPTALFESMNPKIEGHEKLKVLTSAIPWPSDTKRRVLVANFGFGGSNAAILIEEAPGVLPGSPLADSCITITNTNGQASSTPLEKENLFVFSAKSSASLSAYLSSFAQWSAPTASEFVNDLSFTLGQRRTHFPYRVAVAARSVASLQETLSTTSVSSKSSNVRNIVIAFAFTGQGAQHAQMAAGLWHYEPFAAAMRDAEACLAVMGSSWSLSEELSKPEAESRVNDAQISQPACTAVQLAIVLLLRAWGITPAAVIGHSSGEIAAAFTADLISFKTAMAVAYYRGIAAARVLHDKAVHGAMLAVGTSAEEAMKLLPQKGSKYAAIAAINSPRSVTISGDESAIDEILQTAEAQGLFARKLKIGVAYHSRHMDQAADSYLASIQPYFACDKQFSSTEPPSKTFVSSVTGQIMANLKTVDASYWVQNLLCPVRYLSAIETLFQVQHDEIDRAQTSLKSPDVIIEIGPHSALKGPIKQTLDSLREQDDRIRATYMPSLVRGNKAEASLLELAGNLFTMGLDLQFSEINQTDRANVRVVLDLPSYEWNKSKLIHMPRMAAQKLHHGKPYDSLLGWRSPYTEGNEHTFRNIFTLDDIPWLRDHGMGGEILFPFTGFWSLAISALRAVDATSSPTVEIREFHVTKSLRIEEDQRIDITTRLRPAELDTGSHSSTTYVVEILSWSEELGWTSHCKGLIDADVHPMTTQTPTMQSAVDDLANADFEELDAQQEYARGKQNGVFYGPRFQNMIRLWHAPGTVMHQVELRQLSPSISELSPVTVDPATLDSFLHVHGVLQEADGPRPLIVPTYCSRLRISNHIPSVAGQKFTVVCRRLDLDKMSGNMRFSMAVFAILDGTRIPVVEFDALELKCIAKARNANLALQLPASFFVSHVPHVDLVDANQLAKMLSDDDASEQELQHQRDMNAVGVYYLARALKETANDDLSQLPLHLSKFIDWAKSMVSVHSLTLDSIVDPASLSEKVLSGGNAAGKLLCAVGERLPSILRQHVKPLEIMLEDGLLAGFYREERAGIRGNQALAKYVKCLSDINPRMSILEIGAGTGSATVLAMEAMSQGTEGQPAFAHYTFTDVSSGFFDESQTRLARWSDRITYGKLDISSDPLIQGFTAKAYDLIIASNVLHATPDILVTLKHSRELLKPNGKLVLMEAVTHDMPLNLAFPLLPGWWLAEDGYRTGEGPLLSKDTWDRALTTCGFSGVDGAIADYPGRPEHMMSTMWSTNVDAEVTLSAASFAVFMPSNDGEKQFVREVSDEVISQLGCTSRVEDVSELDTASETFCILIDTPQHSWLSKMSSTDFDALKRLLLDTAGVLWVVPEKASPEAETIKGMFRTLRQEDSSRNLFLLENTPYTPSGASGIARMASRLRDSALVQAKEQEFVWRDGHIHVPRLLPLPTAEEVFAAEAGVSFKEVRSIWTDPDILEMTVEDVGDLDSIYFRYSDILAEPLKENEVVIKVEAAGINFRDLLLVLGSMPWHPPGLEGAGVVVRVGSQVKDLQPGDAVFYISNQRGFANYVRIPELHAHRIPGGLSAVDAATLPIAFSTAIICLRKQARLQKGETILIHAASGAVGQALCTIARYLGAEIFVTAGTPEKRKLLRDTFDIPETHIFSSRTSEFRDGILCATNGRGVDVVVNSLSGQLLQQTWNLVADFGRWVEIGKKDLLQNNALGMRPFDRNVTFSGVDVRKLFTQRPEAARECLAEIASLLRKHVIAPIRPTNKIPLSQISLGLRKLQSGQNLGKIVVTMGPDESSVLAERPRLGGPPGSLLRSDATYLISGGTGGIGRDLAVFMIDCLGARNVVLLGRSGSTLPGTAQLLERYMGTNVSLRAIACDVSSKSDVQRAIRTIQDLPKVRGIIHGALYLRGAWNLHNALPDLEFFVSLSSAVGAIGNAGQAIYAGASTFIDAFTAYRINAGLPAVSISLPPVEGVGYAVEHNLLDGLKSSLGVALTVDQLHTIVKAAIVGCSSGIIGTDGKVLAFARSPTADPVPGEQFNPFFALQNPHSRADTNLSLQCGGGNEVQSLDTFEDLMDALSAKISTMTMMDLDEIDPERSLLDYGLDSLVSVELRNWILREVGVEVPLSQLARAANLTTLVNYIMS